MAWMIVEFEWIVLLKEVLLCLLRCAVYQFASRFDASKMISNEKRVTNRQKYVAS